MSKEIIRITKTDQISVLMKRGRNKTDNKISVLLNQKDTEIILSFEIAEKLSRDISNLLMSLILSPNDSDLKMDENFINELLKNS